MIEIAVLARLGNSALLEIKKKQKHIYTCFMQISVRFLPLKTGFIERANYSDSLHGNYHCKMSAPDEHLANQHTTSQFIGLYQPSWFARI